MKTRVIGVLTTLVAITVAFMGIVFVIAAVQDYQENKGRSFIERAASIVGIGPLMKEAEVAQATQGVVERDIDEADTESSDPPEIFRFFGSSEDREEMLDDLFDREWLDREDSFRFEDRIDRIPDISPFHGWEFSGFVPPDWVDGLFERGVITQDELDQLKSWIDNLPDSFSDAMPRFSDERNFEFESDDGYFRFRGRWHLDEPDNDPSEEHEDEDRFELGADKGITF